jgi:hypothetical protein
MLAAIVIGLASVLAIQPAAANENQPSSCIGFGANIPQY